MATTTETRQPEGRVTDKSSLLRWSPLFGLASLFGLSMLTLMAGFLYYYASGEIPAPEDLVIPDPTAVFAANGEQIATLDPAAVRRNVELTGLPEHVSQAVLAAEDRDFRQHIGFSSSALVRALWENLTSGRIVEGGSTITQQYVELAIFDTSRRSYVGKLKELALATKLERRVSKDQILEMYLNAVPLGRGARGIEAGAQTFFRKSAAELTVNEAATLAGTIAAPTTYDLADNPEGADWRRTYVLRAMASEGWLSSAAAEHLISVGLPEVSSSSLVLFGPNSYYLDAVRARLGAELGDERDVFSGLKVTVEMDPHLQRLAQDTLNSHLGRAPYSGAVVTVDPATGAVRAIVGGRDFAKQQFNIATRGRRQAGSAFKTFTLAAFVAKGYSPDTSYPAPAKMSVRTEEGRHTVSNYGGRGYGAVSVREATAQSVNTVYMQMAQDVGTKKVVETAHSMGISSDLPVVPTTTLGVGSVTPLEMASAYATLAAEGTYREPFLIREVVDAKGRTLLKHEPAERRAVDRNVASIVTDVLRDVIRYGTGENADIDRPAAGKTGTTNDSRDAWFVGYVPQLATAVWVGNRDNTPMRDVTGGKIPAEIWGDYMRSALKEVEPEDFPEPETDRLKRPRNEEPSTEQPRARRRRSAPTPSYTPTPSPTQTIPTEVSTSHRRTRDPSSYPTRSRDDDDDDGMFTPWTGWETGHAPT